MSQRIFYIYDALCGWCYGFSPAVRRIYDTFSPEIPFEIISGGMVMGARRGPMTQMAAYIEQASKRITEMTGVEFSPAFYENILYNPQYNGDSEYPGIALSLFKSQRPEESFDFSAALQKALFMEGKSLSDMATYHEIALQFGFEPGEFVAAMQLPEAREIAHSEFDWVKGLGIQGFPAMVGLKDEKLTLLANGCMPFESVQENILKWK
ncbi:MAG: DsbA family protein [Bacteroidetes bacterium]|nr:MAG: DsbA family protein [Bacteroidota bacterium]